MTIVQAILLGSLYWLANSYMTTYIYATGPITLGFITGLILGDPVTGAIAGATIHLAFVGVVFVGGSVATDINIAGIVGAALAITGGLEPQAALALAIPVGLIGNITHNFRMIYFSFFVRMSDKLVEEGKEDLLWVTNVLIPQITYYFISMIPVALLLYFGTGYLASLIETLGGTFLSIITIIGGMLPAVGLAITLSIIYKGEARPFLFVGFLLSTILSFDMVTVSITGLVIAVIYNQLRSKERVFNND